MNCTKHKKSKTPCCVVCLMQERDKYRNALEEIASDELGTCGRARQTIAKESLADYNK